MRDGTLVSTDTNFSFPPVACGWFNRPISAVLQCFSLKVSPGKQPPAIGGTGMHCVRQSSNPEVVQKQIKPPIQQEPRQTRGGDDQQGGGVPILMYHRVAIHGPPELARFRVDPTLFDEQINALKQAGFRPVVLNDYVEAVSRREALAGKPIVLTFDDGYRDFLTAALPALRKYSFVATVFVVTGLIGGVAEWDLRYGAAAPLMSWEELSAIASEGVELGCHSLFHQPMTEMKHADLMIEIRQAREILQLGLGNAVLHFAYPYGAENISVRNLVAVLGFRTAVTCRPGISRLGDDALRLPRIEVPGNCRPEELLIQLAPS